MYRGSTSKRLSVVTPIPYTRPTTTRTWFLEQSIEVRVARLANVYAKLRCVDLIIRFFNSCEGEKRRLYLTRIYLSKVREDMLIDANDGT